MSLPRQETAMIDSQKGDYWQIAPLSSPLGAAPVASEITALFLQYRIIGLDSTSEAVGAAGSQAGLTLGRVFSLLLPTLRAPLLVASPES